MLRLAEVEEPVPGPHELLIRVSACGVCHTELDEIEGRTPPRKLPMIPGHQAVGHVVSAGAGVQNANIGDRVGVGWIFSACGKCAFCTAENENLCHEFLATGRDRPGGYAEYMTVHENFTFPIPRVYTDEEAAPMLCAGAIGYRSLRLTGLKNGQCLGLTGFGASGHLVLKLAHHLFPDSPLFVFARNETERCFARELGASWTGETGDNPPEPCYAIIDTTPVWKPVIDGLKRLLPGGRLIINAIRKESGDQDAWLGMNYTEHLWMEKEIKSVANVTRRDISEFLILAASVPIRPESQVYDFSDANEALNNLKAGKTRGAKVLRIQDSR
jgi:propanol-preferring alcohol dehydrogenase